MKNINILISNPTETWLFPKWNLPSNSFHPPKNIIKLWFPCWNRICIVNSVGTTVCCRIIFRWIRFPAFFGSSYLENTSRRLNSSFGRRLSLCKTGRRYKLVLRQCNELGLVTKSALSAERWGLLDVSQCCKIKNFQFSCLQEWWFFPSSENGGIWCGRKHRQAGEEGERKKKRKEQNWIPQESQTPFLVHFKVQLLLIITHLPILTPRCLDKAERRWKFGQWKCYCCHTSAFLKMLVCSLMD